MRCLNPRGVAFCIGIFLSIYSVSAFGVPVYQLVADNTGNPTYDTDFVVLSPGGDDGPVKIEYHYWYDTASEYHYYSYKVYNNEDGIPGDRTDDYHFGHEYDSGSFVPVNTFNVQFAVEVVNQDEVIILSTQAGSSTGGDPWGPMLDHNLLTGLYTGVDWSTTRGDVNAEPIAPTQWDNLQTNPKKTPDWVIAYSGDTSTDDTSGQYFQFASTWGPGLVDTGVSNGLYSVAGISIIIGPATAPDPIPEPATVLLLGLGSLCLTYRRKKLSK